MIRLFRVITAIVNSNLEGVRPKEVILKEGFSECLQHVMIHSEAYGSSGFCLGTHPSTLTFMPRRGAIWVDGVRWKQW